MTTPWISRPRWTCKYCNITINDDVPSRMQHENGLRHKGNVERSLRETYKKGERERIEEREAKKLMETIEKAAKIRHEQDQISSTSNDDGKVIIGKPTEQNPRSPQQRQKTQTQWKPKDRLSTYGSAIPLHSDDDYNKGNDPTEEEAKRRNEEGLVGEWQTVEPSTSSIPLTNSFDQRIPSSSSSNYKIREKKARYLEEDDQNDLPEIITVKKKIRTGNSEKEFQKREEEKRKAMVPEWTPLQLDTGNAKTKNEDEKKKSEPPKSEGFKTFDESQNDVDITKDERPTTETVKKEEEASEIPASTSSSMFKKRKGGSGAGAKKVRAVI